MGYVIAAILVVLLVAGFVTFLVTNSMRKGAGRGSDPSAPQSDRGGPPGIGRDPTPLGDTAEHAGVDPVGAAPLERGTRPEERQRGNAGAGAGPRPESDRPR